MSNRIFRPLLVGLATLFLSAANVGAGGGVEVLAGGGLHSLVLASDGTVWIWGVSGWWKEGSFRMSPAELSGLDGVVGLAGSSVDDSHSLALKADGTVWAFGDAFAGQLSGPTGIVAIASGGYILPPPSSTSPEPADRIFDRDLALTNDGNVWTLAESELPAQISGLTGVVAITAGFDHRLALKEDGTVWAWGSNTCGQSGDGSPMNVMAPWTRPVRVSGLSEVVAVSAGGGAHFFSFGHSLALKSDGTVWEWGCDGTAVQQPTPKQVSGLTGVVAVAAGGEHSLALRVDGTVWAWGWNFYGQLGNGSRTFGYGQESVIHTPVQVSGLSEVAAIAAGGQHSLALKDDGTVWAWGFNEYGQLGDGSNQNRLKPVQVDLQPAELAGPEASAVVNAASFQAGSIVPVEIVSVFGSQMGPVVGISGQPDGDGGFESTLGLTRVLFDGVAAPLLFARADQVNAVVPHEVSGKPGTEIRVEYRGVKSDPLIVPVAESAPGMFTVSCTGSGQGLILNDDGSWNSASEPARRGSIIDLFATGEGYATLPPTVSIGGQEAEVAEADVLVGLSGVLRVSVRIPDGVDSGPAVPIVLAVGETHSQEGVTVAVQ